MLGEPHTTLQGIPYNSFFAQLLTAEDTDPSTITIQCNLSIKDTLNKGHLSNEDIVCSPKHIELCTNLPLN